MIRNNASAWLAASLAVSLMATGLALAQGNSAGNGRGGGNGYANGRGGGGTASGAPIPLLGLTALGQLAGAGGLALIYFRRRKRRSESKPREEVSH
jgi:hypothetical protein